ncbi:DUF2726 domain-containing protein [Geopsychrobacter electrodiphilus]|uniref:DUF2726 domain-containing protein n=1 Tax=Geopsychrobacter electrodiphilus TaxID=225196 RepID=UPI000366FA39|nr:DUF2726 domain-containing protein [Geopsychrobacter electrodiphilus]
MNTLLIVAVVLIVLGFLAVFLQKQTSASPSALTFKSRGELFTPAERSFLGVLQQAVGDEFSIFGKVRLGDLIKPSSGLNPSQRLSTLNKINLKHIDFLICRADNLAFVAAVELDDKSHRRKDRSERDVFVDQALSSAEIPIVRFAAQKSYELTDVKQRIAAVTNSTLAESSVTPPTEEFSLGNQIQPGVEQSVNDFHMQPDEVSQSPAVLTCPACQSVMVKRQAKKGANAGNWFWACSTFPKCRKVIAIES